MACAVTGPMAARAGGQQTEAALGSTLPGLLAYARAHHPALAASAREADAARERVLPARSLSDPLLRIELRDFTNEAGTGNPGLLPGRIGGARYVLAQPLPWPGKRDLRGAVAQARADAVAGQGDLIWNELAWQIKLAFAEHYLHQTRLAYTTENMALLEQIESIAQVRYAHGLVPQQDVLRAFTERSALEGELLLLQGEDQEVAARLATLLGSPDQPLAAPARLPELPPAALLAPERLHAPLQDANPDLAVTAARVDEAEKNRALVRLGRYPDLGIGLAANQVDERVASWDLFIEVNLPLRLDRRNAEEREAAASWYAARDRHQASLNAALGALNEHLAALAAAGRVETLTRDSLLPEAELTLESAMIGYETGQVDFATVLDAQRQLRRAQEALVRAEVLQRIHLAGVERAVGRELGESP